jgi:hypothetical protein
MKRFGVFILAAMLAFAGLTGCSTKDKESTSDDEQEVVQEDVQPQSTEIQADDQPQQSDDDQSSGDAPSVSNPIAMADLTQWIERDNIRYKDLGYVSMSLERYYEEHQNSYPVVDLYDELRDALVDYLEEFPSDPSMAGNYRYLVAPDGSAFVLGSWLEAKKDFYAVDSMWGDSAVLKELEVAIEGVTPFVYPDIFYQFDDQAVEEDTSGNSDEENDMDRKVDFANVRTALELFYSSNSYKYPVVSSYDELQVEVEEYIQYGSWPQDPVSPGNYHYEVEGEGTGYLLWTTLSDGSRYEVDDAQGD